MIARYWLGTEEGPRRLPGNFALGDFGEPCCFACGDPATHPEEPPEIWSVWNRARLERCHLVPRMLGGDERPENLVLLCAECHREAPDVADPQYMLDWIGRREARMVRQMRAMNDAMEAAGLRARFDALSLDEAVAILEDFPALLGQFAGVHGTRISDATLGAAAVEALRRWDRARQSPAV